MRMICYCRYEPGASLEDRTGTLLEFVYDVPYLSTCGVLPSFEVLNEMIGTGGGDGGMSPGASWTPFEVSREEYDELCEAIESTPVSSLRGSARYIYIKLVRTPEFDHIRDWIEWAQAVSAKYRESFLAKADEAFGMTE